MSHTIGQAEQNTRESNSNSIPHQDSLNPDNESAESTSGLSDADYEFLFNQLLEGIAHGWHERRIIKFFKQLGDRGQQAEWVAWLERLRTKVLKLPIQSKRQLGTIMIRLGELTQSAKEVEQIGAASRRIGRELLFGNAPAKIWEYVGPDLASASKKLETEQEFSQRLPDDFTALGAEAVDEKTDSAFEIESPWDTDIRSEPDESIDAIAAIVTPTVEDPENEVLEESEKTAESNGVSSLESVSSSDSNLDRADRDLEPNLAFDVSGSEGNLDDANIARANSATADTLENDVDLASTSNASANEADLDNELDSYFEMLDDEFSEPAAEMLDNADRDTPPDSLDLNLDPVSNSPSRLPEELNLDFDLDNELDSAEQIKSDGGEFKFELEERTASEISLTNNNAAATDPSNLADALHIFELEAESLDSNEQNVDELTAASAQEQSQIELSDNEPQSLALSQQPKAMAANLATESQLDESSLEVIESWFNLGLKQVSAGEYDRAIASWDKALTINANLSEAWHNRGSALGRLGNYEEAVKSFQNALKIDPDNYQAWNDRAHALYQLKNWSDAADSWSRAIEIMPGNHLYWYNRGCALEQLSHWREAIASYEKALEIKPDFQPGRSRYINLVADNSRPN